MRSEQGVPGYDQTELDRRKQRAYTQIKWRIKHPTLKAIDERKRSRYYCRELYAFEWLKRGVGEKNKKAGCNTERNALFYQPGIKIRIKCENDILQVERDSSDLRRENLEREEDRMWGGRST